MPDPNTTVDMTGFKIPNPFQSLMGYGGGAITPAVTPPDIGTMSAKSMGFNDLPIDPMTGQTDWLKSLQSPALTGVDIGAVGAGTPGMFDGMKNWLTDSGFLGKTENGVTSQGWGGMALGAAQGIGNAFMGMKQYGLAKDQLAQSKKQFELNFGAQQKTTNAALSDRQTARVASNPGAYQSVGDYMKKNGI